MAFDTTELLASIRQRAMLPAVAAEGTADADLLRVASEELRANLVPKILSLREELFVATQTYLLQEGRRAYRLPLRAAGRKLNRVYLTQADGSERPLALISPSDRGAFALSGTPVAYFLEGNNIVLVPTPGAGDTSLMVGATYYLRQSQLVPTTSAAKIISISPPGELVVDTAFLAPPPPYVTLDFIRASDGEILVLEEFAANFASGPPHVLTVFSTDPLLAAGVNPGDWVALSQQTPVPYLPEDLLPWLAQAVAVKVLASLGDNENLGAAAQELEKLEQNAVLLLNPRVDAQKRVLVDNSLLSLLE